MSRTAEIKVRVEPELKAQVINLLDRIGLTQSEAVNLYYHKIVEEQGIPFSLKVPNAETRKVFSETDLAEGLIKTKNADDLFKRLGI